MQNLIGYKFGRLTVLAWHGKNKQGNNTWLCECECGNKVVVRTADLNNGHTKSCGCLTKDNFRKVITKHEKRNTRLYSVWSNMRNRCNNPSSERFNQYGGRGITICKEWEHFETFYEWALANGYSNNLTIDRIDNSKGYSPNNCRWASSSEQNSNTRRNHLITYGGKTQTMTQWAEEIGIVVGTLESRLNRSHWSIERALTTPKQR